MRAHRGTSGLFDRLRVSFLFRTPFANAPALRQIAVQRVMGAGLVGDDIGARAARFHAGHQFGEHICGVTQQAHRLGLALGGPFGNHRQRLVQRLGLGIDVTGTQAEIDPRLVAFHGETACPCHHSRQRLRPAHAAKTTRQDPFALERPAKVLTARLGKGLVSALNDALSADVDP